MDAKPIKVNGTISSLALVGCNDLCRVLIALDQLIVDNGGQGSTLSILLTPMNPNAT
jgi:hypothetical protein